MKSLPQWQRLFLAMATGCFVLHLGGRLLDVRIELFWGLSTFDFKWVLTMFLVPFVAGAVVSMIYGLGGKVMCYFPPLIVHAISYADTLYLSGIPQGASLMPLGWWGFFVVVVIEASAIGGFLGEYWIKSTYGRQSILKPIVDEQPSTTHASKE